MMPTRMSDLGRQEPSRRRTEALRPALALSTFLLFFLLLPFFSSRFVLDRRRVRSGATAAPSRSRTRRADGVLRHARGLAQASVRIPRQLETCATSALVGTSSGRGLHFSPRSATPSSSSPRTWRWSGSITTHSRLHPSTRWMTRLDSRRMVGSLRPRKSTESPRSGGEGRSWGAGQGGLAAGGDGGA
eukprot:scaffold4495_cov117-Isochrysis_galbana.AAC.2